MIPGDDDSPKVISQAGIRVIPRDP